MNIFEIGMIFILSWWICLFVVLPIGVQSQADHGKVTLGTASGAPVRHNIAKKFIWATCGGTLAAAIICGIIILFGNQ